LSKRTAALAQIQGYLAGDPAGQAPAPAADDTVLPGIAAPHAAPGTQPTAPEPESREELQRQRAQIGRDRDALKLQQEQTAISDEQKSVLEEQTDLAAAKMQQVVNYGKFRIEGIPMPGGLFLPIALLFIFFLALLPIGGQTRLQWLWAVISGNAALNQAEDPTGDFPKTGGPPLPLTGPAPTSGNGNAPIPPGPGGFIPLFTGVEDM
jgi:hypothetical protein